MSKSKSESSRALNLFDRVMKFLLVLLIALAPLAMAAPSPFAETNTRERLLASNPELIKGDMLLIPDQVRNGIIGDRYRWPGGVVRYQLDPAFTANERATIQSAMNDIQSKSCVRFQERTTQPDYVYIIRGGAGTGCWAYVGRIGGRQTLNLEAPGCINARGPGPHELMHAVGFNHEHSREDRDDYVRIFWENIDPPLYYAFDKEPGLTYGIPYDYLSIMQYPKYAFSMNGQDTMAPTTPGVPFGPYDYLSVDDGRKINIMYQNICP